MEKQRTRHVKISRNKAAVIFDKRKPPVEGDTITVGDMVATFQKVK